MPPVQRAFPNAVIPAWHFLRYGRGVSRTCRSRNCIGASPGGFGTILSQNAWLPVLRTLGTRHWAEGRLMVSRAGKLFDEAGALTDDGTRDQLRHFLQGFAAFVESCSGSRT